MEGRSSNGKFTKGWKGGGRPAIASEVRRAAQEKGTRCIERLSEIAESNDLPAAVAACKAILDRGFGKPMQQVKKTVTHVKRSPRELSLEEIEKRIAELAMEAAH